MIITYRPLSNSTHNSNFFRTQVANATRDKSVQEAHPAALLTIS